MNFCITETGELIESVLMRRFNGKDDEDCLLQVLQSYYDFDVKPVIVNPPPDEFVYYPVSQWEWEKICDDMSEEVELFGFKSNMCSFVSHLSTPEAKQAYYATSGASYEFTPYVP